MILLVQFRDDVSEEHEQKCVVKHLDKNENIKFISTLDDNHDWSDPEKILYGYDSLIIGGNGSSSFDGGKVKDEYQLNQINQIFRNVNPLLDYVIDKDFPTLGTCFGHQLIANRLGSEIKCDPNQAESGIEEITLNETALKDPIFSEIPEKFDAVVGHQDSVINLSEGMISLASSKHCNIEAFKYKNNIYCTQFHSELNTDDLIFRLNLYPNYKKYARNLVPKDTSNTINILRNFLKMNSK